MYRTHPYSFRRSKRLARTQMSRMFTLSQNGYGEYYISTSRCLARILVLPLGWAPVRRNGPVAVPKSNPISLYLPRSLSPLWS